MNELSSMKIKGKCFEDETILKLFQITGKNGPETVQSSIIYGVNGSGKSTISDYIYMKANDKLCENDVVEFLNINGEVIEEIEGIYVYDELFQRNKVKIYEKDNLESIVMFGVQNDIDDKLKEKEEEKSKLDVKKTKKIDELEKYTSKESKKSQEHYISEIKKKLKEKDGWAEKSKRIKGLTISSQVTNKIIDDIKGKIIKGFDQGKLTQELEKLINNLESTKTTSVAYNKINYSINIDFLKFKKLCETEVAKINISDDELAKRIINELKDKHEAFGETKVFFDSGVEYCPKCFNDISTSHVQDVLGALSKIQNKASEELILKLKEYNDILIPEFDSYANLDPKKYAKLMESKSNFVNSIEKFKSIIKDKMGTKLHEKYIIVEDIKEIEKDVNIFVKSIDDLNVKIEEINKVIANRKENINKAVKINFLIARFSIDKLLKESIQNEKKELAISKELETINGDIEIIEKEIEGLRAEKKNVKIAIDEINLSLLQIFSNKKISIEIEDNEYSIKINNRKVKLNELSTGEKNVISLCYFFTTINENVEDIKKFEHVNLIVLDDPITSFDYGNQVGVLNFISSRIQKIIKQNNDTKFMILTHRLESVDSFDTMLKQIVSGQVSKKQLISKELEKIGRLNVYSRLVQYIIEFVIDDNNDEYRVMTIGNQIRKVLEAFCTFTYNRGINRIIKNINEYTEHDKRDKIIHNQLSKFINMESHLLDQAKAFGEELGYAHFSEQDMKEISKTTLILLYMLNSHHVKMYAESCERKEIIRTIEKWIDDL